MAVRADDIAPSVSLMQGDCIEVMREMEDESIDAIVCDPPAGINFMNRSWDADKGGRASWVAWMTEVMSECFRIAKPGSHALVWALPRTSHWTATAIEDAGWDVRDVVTHHFGSGFPKSMDVSKAIDKAEGAERDVLGLAADFARDGKKRKTDGSHVRPTQQHPAGDRWAQPVTAPATDAAKQWDGWGTALKPATEFWILARKPLTGTVAQNVLTHGTGALNLDATRVPHNEPLKPMKAQAKVESIIQQSGRYEDTTELKANGRWPSNLILSHSPDCADNVCAEDCPVAEMDRQSGVSTSRQGSYGGASGRYGIYGSKGGRDRAIGPCDSGGASRFFPVFRYEAKASSRERTLPDGTRSSHPTVKPLPLVRWLVRLVTPPGGILCDPFAGSGSTLVAAIEEGFSVIGIEKEPEYCAIAQQRIDRARATTRQNSLFGGL